MKNLLLVLTIVIYVSCQHSTEPNKETSNWWPLEVNNSWHYKGIPDFSYSDSISLSVLIKDVEYFKFEGCFLDGYSDLFIIREENSRIYYYDQSDNDEFVLLDFNMNVGDTLLYPKSLKHFCEHGVILLSKSEDVITSSRTFKNCWHFKHINMCMDGGVEETWFCKGVGFVKYKSVSYIGYINGTLESYNFN